jgi:hypothetical protein
MRRFLVVATLLAALTVPLAHAGGSQTDGTLSVKRGRGTLMLKLKGTVIGRVNTNGRVQVRDFKPPPSGAAPSTSTASARPASATD